MFFKVLQGGTAGWVGQDLTEREHGVFQAQMRFLEAEAETFWRFWFSVFGNFGFGIESSWSLPLGGDPKVLRGTSSS